jgi:hypothetical protein
MKRALLLAWLATVPLSNLFPQSAAPPAVLQISREAIKEGKGAAHRKVEQDFAGAFRKNNIPFHYLALSTESGPNEVWFMDAYPSFAALEESDRLGSQAPFRNEIDAVEARDGELRTGSHSMTAVYRGDLSYLPANPLSIGKTRYVMIGTYRIRLGHEEDFTSAATMILNADKKAMLDSSVLVYQVIAGAPDGTYLLLSPMASLRELDTQPARQQALVNAMGPDSFRRLVKSAGDVFESMQNTLFAVSPDMSYVSKETEEEDPGFWRPAPAPAKSKGRAETSGK